MRINGQFDMTTLVTNSNSLIHPWLLMMSAASAITEGLTLNRDNALVHRANWQSGTRNMVRMLRSAPSYEDDTSASESNSATANQPENPAALYNLRNAEVLFKPRTYQEVTEALSPNE